MKSWWCQREYGAFCGANHDQRPPKHEDSSRILNVRLNELHSKSHKEMYKRKFSHSTGYDFYESDPNQDGPVPLDPDKLYRNRISLLALDIGRLLESMKKKPKRTPSGLDEVLLQARKHIIISANTFNRFSDGDKGGKVSEALKSSLAKGVGATIIMLNPESASAQAHAPYYPLESSATAEVHYNKALDFLGDLFKSLDDGSKARLEVLLSNYMPRFRTIVIDGKRVYLYAYLYNQNVNEYPDFVLEKKDPMFKRVIESTHSLRNAPEIIPYIRDSRVYEYWKDSKLAQWDRWTPIVKYRHRITHQYYVKHAEKFHLRFGDTPELYVQKHLNLLKGRAIVLGCGSGREVEHLSKLGRCSDLYGVDFSPEAIRLARSERSDSRAKFIVADFYDLEHIVDCIVKGEVDSIAANATFVHLFERQDMSKMLHCIWKKLRPGGLCFIRNLYRENEIDGNPADDHTHGTKDRFNDDRWFVYYSRAYLAELAKDAGFIVDNKATKEIWSKNPREMWEEWRGESTVETWKEVMGKGFRHEKFPGVWWSTILLKKPVGNKGRRT
jgi:SAM-dependent methyltransferase